MQNITPCDGIDSTASIANLEQSLKAISKLPEVKSLSSASNVLLKTVISIKDLTGTADEIASSLPNIVTKAFDTVADVISSLSVLDELYEILNDILLNVKKGLNEIFNALSSDATGADSTILDSSFVKAGRTLLNSVDAINAVTYVANAIRKDIDNTISTAVTTLSVVLSTVVSIGEFVMIIAAEASGKNASKTLTNVINGVKSAVKIVLKVLRIIIKGAPNLISILLDISNSLRAATSAFIDAAGQTINVARVAIGIISGLSSSLSTIVFSLTKSLDEDAGGIISGISGISGGVGGVLGDLVVATVKMWGIDESLDDIIKFLSGIVSIASSSTGDISGIVNGISSSSNGSLLSVTSIIYEAIEATTSLGTSLIVEDVTSIIKSVYNTLDEAVVSITDGIGLDLAKIIKNALYMVNVALRDITRVTGTITHDSDVPDKLQGSTYRLASAIYLFVGTVSFITGETAKRIPENCRESLANSIASLSVILSVVLLMAQEILILIFGALVLVTGKIDTDVNTLTSTVVPAVQLSIDTLETIIRSLEGGVCTKFGDITSLLKKTTDNILSGISTIKGSGYSLTDTMKESISTSVDAIVKQKS